MRPGTDSFIDGGFPSPRFARSKCLVVAGLLLAGLTRGGAEVVINEIHYNPDVKTERVEFIELFNAGAAALDLAGWQFTDGVQFTFPATTLPAGGYVVVAENPAALKAKFGVDALGPFIGNLSKYGERLVLRDAAGNKADEVDYQPGFPWPTVGDPPGYSIELINPALDNDLGGSWRVSVAGGASQPQTQTPINPGSPWRYFKGTQEASVPTTAWRENGFDDAAWSVGALPIGYDPALPLGTRLDDMRYQYTSVFLRRAFSVSDPAKVSTLILEALYDDGFKVWINGNRVLDVNISAGEVPFDGTAATAIESNDFATFTIDNAGRFLRAGPNVIAVQLHNASRGNSSDCFFDGRLTAQTGPRSRGPTPGRLNAAYADNAPPQIRQVEHTPTQPHSGEPVLITAKVTDPDGVAAVTLHYQLVDPGAYIELTDAAYETTWTDVPMNDAGAGGDAVANDNVFTATLPPGVQTNRRLVRYRITVADALGNQVRVPYADDSQPNFAYFVYDGVPAWTGAVRPGAAGSLGQPFTVSAEQMNRLPVLHLIGKQSIIETSTWFSRYGGDAYPWLGTLVYDGRVYDHIHHRARGGVWRYSMVKNMWKFDLNRGHDFQARDDWGRKFKTAWTKLNLGACIQQGDYNHRGEQGMFESVGLRLFQLAGVPASDTAFAQLRVVDAPAEVNPTNQFAGDFWGVYLMVEQENGRFLEQHDLPDSNFYKMEGGTGELNNLGPLGPTDKSDLNPFLAVANGGASADEAWWRANLNLPAYLSYQTIVQAIHHYDICYDKNFFYYFAPGTRTVTVTPWDLDLTWAENMYDAGCGGVDRIKARILAGAARYPALWREWQNRIREVRDLLWNEDEAWRLIDEYAGRLRGPSDQPGILDADRAQWDYNPKMLDSTYTPNVGKAGQGRFYKWPNEPSVSKDFAGCVQLMKNYVTFRATSPSARAKALDSIANDSAIPAAPTLTYTGPANYPVNALRFRVSAYSGAAAFGAMKWRVGEITRPTAPNWQASEPWKYEIAPIWESTEVPSFSEQIAIPPGALKAGHVYRARVRFKDAEGRTSHWSAPVEFVAGEPDNLTELQRSLRVTELMYHPPAGSAHEFIELHNASPDTTLSLAGAAFTQGIDYAFPAGAELAPGAYALVVQAEPANNFAAFRAHYGLAGDVPIFGPYNGSLNDAGEQVTFKAAAGGTNLISFKYSDGPGWPLAADGAGHSLVPRCDFGEAATGALDFGGNWRPSAFIGGSPGREDPSRHDELAVSEIASHTDYLSELDSNDWIELRSRLATDRVLGPAWFLSDSAADLRKWQIPAGTLLPANGWVSFDEVTGFHNPTNLGFGLNKAGDQVFLSHLPGGGQDRVVDAVSFKGQANGWSFVRFDRGEAADNSDDLWDAATPRTRDAANAAIPPRVAIAEIMYHEGGLPTNIVDPARLEFLELHNGAAKSLALFDTNGTWRVRGGVEFDFPPNVALAPDQRVLVVPFDPAVDAATLAGFRQVYDLSATVRLFGPYQGRLGNDTDRVTLEKPLAPDLPGDPVAWAVVDEVIYFDQAPWPGGADGQAQSYRRIDEARPGSDWNNWFAASPTPGAVGVETDTDHDGMTDAWELAHDFDPKNPSDAALDADADGLTNLQEFLAGTDPRDPDSLLRIETLSVAVDGTITIRCRVGAGQTYSLLATADLEADSWSAIQPVLSGPGETEVTITLPAPGDRYRFYRLGK